MNAPYDGDGGQRASGEPAGQAPPPPPAQGPCAQEEHPHSPYQAQHPTPQGSVAKTLHDRAASPPTGASPGRQPMHPQSRPASPQHAAGSQPWVPLPVPGPDGSSRPAPYGEDTEAMQYADADDLVNQASDQRPEHSRDAFAHLYHDQRQAYESPPSAQQIPPPADSVPPPVPSAPESDVTLSKRSDGGRASGLLKSSAIMAAGTMVSRLTGFIRSALAVAALGAAVLGDTYQLAITLPTMIYILTIGGGLNSVFVPQLVRAMKKDEDGGEAYANRLLTLVAVVLGGLVLVAVFAAPLLVRLMSIKIADDPAANEVAIAFVRYCLPTIFFMGVHVVMGQILSARGRFGAMMWTPVLNNIVIITTLVLFIWVYGTARTSRMGVTTIPPEGVQLLGVGTLLGLVVQALAMIPYLREAGFRIRPRFDWRGHGLGKAAKLAKWTVLFVLANQTGVIVVSQLSTWAGDLASREGHSGAGYIAYSNAQLIWGMPQAIITVSVMAALLPRLSRSAHDGDIGAVRDDISQGLRNSAVAIVPIAFGFVALGVPMCTLIYGSSGTDSARSMGYMLMAFGLGLIPFSVQYVVLRAFYAYEDTRTPFYNTVIVAAVNAVASALCFLMLPARWAVVGMAASYGLAYAIGVVVAWKRLCTRLGGDLDGARVLRTYARLGGASIPAALVGSAVGYGIIQALGYGVLGSLTGLTGGGIALLMVFYVAARRMRIEELTALVGMVRGRLGR